MAERDSIDVSVILPVFNGVAFVEDAIASILRQNGPALEILIRNDGSTDNTLALLQRLANSDTRIKLTTGENEGPAACRNRCLERAVGAFVAFLDHDDLWPDGRLARQFERLKSHRDAAAILGHTLMFDVLDAAGQPAPSPRLRRVFAGLLQAGLFRRKVLTKIGHFDGTLPAADDFDMILRLLEQGHRIETDEDVSVYYRVHPLQRTADLRFTGLQTARALSRSLRRRRADGLLADQLRPTILFRS